MEQEPKNIFTESENPIHKEHGPDSLQALKEALGSELSTARRSLYGIMDEGGIRLSLDQLEFRIKTADESISRALKMIEKLK